MSQKTYVLLTNDSRSGRKDAYTPVIFNTRGLALKCKEVDHTLDFVFSTAQELCDGYEMSELKGTYQTLTLDGSAFTSKIEVAKAIFAWTTSRADKYVPRNQGSSKVEAAYEHVESNELDQAATQDEANAVTEKKAKKAKKAKAPKEPKAAKAPKEAGERSPREVKHKLYSNDQAIVKLVETPTIGEGTNRYRNMQVVIDSLTVGDALRALKSLTPPGVPADIDLAIAKGAIEVK